MKNIFKIEKKENLNYFIKTIIVSFIFFVLDYFFILTLTDWTRNFENYSLLSLIWSSLTLTLFYTFLTMFFRELVSFFIGFSLVFVYSIASFFKNMYLGAPIVISDLIFAKEVGGLINMIGDNAIYTLLSLHLVTFVAWFFIRYVLFSCLYNRGLFSLILSLVKTKNDTNTKDNKKKNGKRLNKEEKSFFIKDNLKFGTYCFISLLLLFGIFPYLINWNTYRPDVRTYIHSYGVVGGLYGEYLMSRKGPDDDYTKEKAIEILNTYNDKEETKNIFPQNMDVVIVLSEAFWNPNKLEDYEITLKEEHKNNKYKTPYEPWEKLSKEGLSLNLNVPVYAGITVNTEYELLTGYSFAKDTDGYVAFTTEFQRKKRDDIPSIVKEFKKENYNTIAISPFYVEKIYGCDVAYEKLGFDKTYLWSDYYDEAIERNEIKYSRWFYDRYIFKKALSCLSNDKDFIFIKTVENHMPYYSIKYEEEEMLFEVNGQNKEWCEKIKMYSNGIYNSCIALENLWNELKVNENPTMLVVFGDHLPALTDDAGVDILSNFITKEKNNVDNYKNKYTTDCLILTNFEYNQEEFLASNQRDISPWLLGSTILKTTLPQNDNLWFNYVYHYGREIPIMTKQYIKNKDNQIFDYSNKKEIKEIFPQNILNMMQEHSYVQWHIFEDN